MHDRPTPAAHTIRVFVGFVVQKVFGIFVQPDWVVPLNPVHARSRRPLANIKVEVQH